MNSPYGLGWRRQVRILAPEPESGWGVPHIRYVIGRSYTMTRGPHWGLEVRRRELRSSEARLKFRSLSRRMAL